MKFTDMHCHIIYGVDDGARTPEDMHGMLRLAAENGIDHIVCTSHITPGEAEFPARKYLEHLQEGQRYCDEQGLGIQMHLGSEILWTEMTPQMIRDGKVPTLDRSWTVLVEFWWDVDFALMCKAARLMGNEGMSVVLAHLERYKPLRTIGNIRTLAEEYGVVMQMNCKTITEKQGLSGDHWRNKVLEEGLVDLVASDAHNTGSRACNMKQCHEVLTSRYGADYADRLCGENQHRLFGWKD
ncbi:MAG: hypothetical protein IKP40_09520 [Clostridia bacterium]|nr:hypothetical protein [Clostridia bacterium]